MNWIQERLPSRGWIAACLAPVLISMVLSMLLQPQPASLAAPLLGPWAGWLLGHDECTLGAMWPRRAFSLLIVGAIFLVWRLRENDEAVRGALGVVLVIWLTIWCAFAVLSVLNTTS